MISRSRAIGPKLVVTGAVIAIAGAVSGAAIGGTSVKYQKLSHDSLPEAAIQHAKAERGEASEPLPNHYAIETPEGRFEVAELRSRGLYRNERYQRTYYRTDLFEETVGLDAQQPDLAAASRNAATEAAAMAERVEPSVATVETTQAQRASTLPKAPLFEQPRAEPAPAQAKMIDVSAELPSRTDTAPQPVTIP